MEKTARKKLYTIVILAAVILFVVFSTLSKPKITGVKELTFAFADYDYSVMVTNAVDVNAFMDVVNSFAKTFIAEEGAWEPVFTVRFADGQQKQYFYQFYRNPGNQTAYYIKTEENKYFSVSYENMNELLLSEDFDVLYSDNTPPSLSVLADGGQQEILPQNYTWYYRKIDGRYYHVISSDDEGEMPLFSGEPEIPEIGGAEETTVSVWQNQKMLYEGALSEFAPSESGVYEYHVKVQYQQGNLEGAYGTAEYHFQVQIELQPEFELSSESLESGEVIYLYARYFDKADAITAETDMNFTPQFFALDENTQVALLPLSYYRDYGTYRLSLRSEELTQTYSITIREREWEIQNLTADTSVTSETIDSTEANNEFYAKIEPIQQISDNKKYFSGVFIQPVEGEITTDFGSIRYVNGQPTSVRHGAIDIAAKEGTPVKAAGGGRVVFAEYLQLTGNTVVIEHGFGIKSWYYHMNSLSVAVDDMVGQGDMIGTVGTTGFSTGPHLHFGMSVNNVWINPWTAFETEMLPAPGKTG